jgi:hypothetical protein
VFALPGPGARVVVAPYARDQNGGTPHSQTATLVRDLMLDILAAHDEKLSNSLAAVPVPSWSEEGIAVAVQALYQANIDPAPATYDFSLLTAALGRLPPSYRTGRTRDTGQLFGTSLTADEDWNDVAASVYEYIEVKYGMNQMLASAVLLYTRDPAPFGNVLKSSGDNSYTFYPQAAVTAGWRAWLARL